MKTIYLHNMAPSKPAYGEICNGCGVCCAASPCPVAIMLLWQFKGSCQALEWDETTQRYVCGFVKQPRAHLPWLPKMLETSVKRFCLSRIAAGLGCDCDLEQIN